MASHAVGRHRRNRSAYGIQLIVGGLQATIDRGSGVVMDHAGLAGSVE